jgi:hypothetical protein
MRMTPTAGPDTEFYALPAPMTAFDAQHEDALTGLPDDPDGLRRCVTGLVIHPFMADWLYGLALTPDRLAEKEQRPAAAIVATALDHDPRPLAESRPPESRAVGVCRNFTVLHVAFLRQIGVPARARCGFASYFEPGKWVDHWVTEVWDPAAARWRRADPQLDDRQLEGFHIDFDPAELPPGRFLSGGEAWQLIRAGNADPDVFGILDLWGAWMVRANAVRDLAALNKVELLPWDAWGRMLRVELAGQPDDDAYIDEITAATTTGSVADVREVYRRDDLRVPPRITTFTDSEAREVELPAAVASGLRESGGVGG